ncbi:hypothetical protein GCM10029964_033230 [Kibdelosporangium lantanae]
MSEQLTVAVISSSVALVVAVMGFIATIRAQVVSTRRAFQNSLALFEKQTADQARTRFADTKRTTYGTVMRLADDLVAVRAAEEHAAVDLERTERAFHQHGLAKAEVERSRGAFTDARTLVTDRTRQLDQAINEVELLATDPVRTAAVALRSLAKEPDDTYPAVREAFLLAARAELGISTTV